MISATPPVGKADVPFPRRDILAICAFLNRHHEAPKADRDLFEHAEGILRKLAAAARMQ